MREMVFRERQERVAHLEAIGKMVAKVFNMDSDKLFGHVVSEYAQEVFQETYDADLLRRKVNALRAAQKRISRRKSEDLRQLDRLERMGMFYDQTLGPDLQPLPPKTKAPKVPVKPSTRKPSR